MRFAVLLLAVGILTVGCDTDDEPTPVERCTEIWECLDSRCDRMLAMYDPDDAAGVMDYRLCVEGCTGADYVSLDDQPSLFVDDWSVEFIAQAAFSCEREIDDVTCGGVEAACFVED